MARPTLLAKARQAEGTRRVRRLRRNGLVPGIVYGKKTSPLSVMISAQDLAKFLRARAGVHGVVTLRVDADPASGDAAKGGIGSKPWEKPVLVKRLERDPVNGEIVHVEFHAIALTEQIRVKVPILLNGTPVGVKQDGGVLEHFLRELEVECLPTAIPKDITYDVSAMRIGDTVHVRELAAPAGAKVTTDAAAVIASVLAPKEEKAEEVAAAVTEPEVIREKKPEAEEAAGEAAEGKKEPTPKEEKKKEEK